MISSHSFIFLPYNSSYEFPHSSQYSQYPGAYSTYHPMAAPPPHIWPSLGGWTPATGSDGWPDSRLPPSTPNPTAMGLPPGAVPVQPGATPLPKWPVTSPRDGPRDRDKDHRDRTSPDRKKRSKKKKEKENTPVVEETKTLDLDTR